jgi:hypothetical protein
MLRAARLASSLLLLQGCQDKTSTAPAEVRRVEAGVVVAPVVKRETSDAGVSWALAASVPLTSSTRASTEPLDAWLISVLGTPAMLYDEAGEQKASWTATVAGAPEVTAFAHLAAADGGLFVGVSSNDQATLYAGAWLPLSTSRLMAFAIPAHRDEYIVCFTEDCSRGGKCSRAHLAERLRRCAWLAPECPGAPGAGLHFDRIDHKKKALVAELFSAPVSCAPRDGASPQWWAVRGKVEGVSPTWLLRGELEVAGCAEPRWSKLLEAQAWSEQSNALESVVVPIRCE